MLFFQSGIAKKWKDIRNWKNETDNSEPQEDEDTFQN